MFDMHYDLLSVAYTCYLKQDFSYLERWCQAYRPDNIKGVFANLYFMSKKEMIEELHPLYYQENVSVIKMFQIAKEIVESFLPDTEIIYSIEGCDFLKIEDLNILYELGLCAILPVWNNQNQYASGNRSMNGLTPLGKKFITHAIDLGIAIDLSHANEQSFYDIIEVIKEEQEKGKKVICYASHSNSRTLCNRPRNLKDEQLKALTEIGGTVGVFSNRNFIVNDEEKEVITEEEKQQRYLDHINHITSIIGVDYTAISTDNMDFCKEVDSEYGEVNIYSYANIYTTLKKSLSTIYSQEDTEKILYGNAQKIAEQLSIKKKNKNLS